MYTLLHSVLPALQQATTDPCLCQRPLDTHGQIWVSFLWGHCSFLLDPDVHRVLFVPSKSLFPQSCVSSGGSIVGLMVTCSKGIYAIPRSTAPRAPDPAAVHCWPVPPQETLKQFCLSLCRVSGSWCTQGMFEPSEHPWWVWSLISNMILPLLPSCWGFSFALGCWVSPQSRPSAMQSQLHRPPFFWGFSALGCGIYMSVYTFKASQVALVVKKLPANTGDVRDASLILGSGRSLGGGHGNPFPYSYLTNLMDGAAWWATDHRDAKSQTWLKQLNTHAYTFNIWYGWMYTDIYLFYLNVIILFRGPYLIRWFQVYFVKVYIDDPHIHIIFQLQIFSSIFGSGMLTEICKLKFLDSFAMISASCVRER